jgi:HlyD family secretion protein
LARHWLFKVCYLQTNEAAMDIPVARRKTNLLSKFNSIWLLLALVVVTVLSIPFFLSDAMPSVDESEVWVGEVKRGQMAREVRGVGVLAPSSIRWIVSASAGRVERLLIKPGARVGKGSVIAHVSNPQLNRQLQQAQWDFDAAQAKLLAVTAELEEQKLEQQMLVTEAELSLESANMLEQAQLPLAQKNIISDIDFENTKLQTRQSEIMLTFRRKTQQRRLEVIEARLKAEKAQVQKYDNLVSNIEAQVAELTITAGIDGVLQALSVEVGQQVDVGSTIAHVADPASLVAELQIPQVQAKDITLDLLVSVDTRNGLIEGRVSRIDPRVSQGNVQVDVELVSKLPQGVRPDLSVTGIITIESIQDALYVERPSGVSPQTESNLFVLDPRSQIANQTTVNLGRASVNQVEILSGLSVGDFVLISDTSAFGQHPSIRITQ